MSKRILLAMSGGVDSSTAAVLLRDQGYQVVGCTMQLWDHRRNPGQQFGSCCSLDDVHDARRIAQLLDFPFYVLNLQKPFEKQVIQPFIQEYLEGRTPVPCTLCNTFLKFDKLLLFARQVGIDCVATGHYARIEGDSQRGFRLRKGLDPLKDQSYYLFELTQQQLARIQFPVGEYRKPAVREIARENALLTAEKRESQEICFVPDRDYAGFIGRHAAEVSPGLVTLLDRSQQPGPILFKDGTPLGKHRGLYRFTVGQRRGLRVAHSQPLYVLRLDTARNAVIVGHREDVYSWGLMADRVNWIPDSLPGASFQAQVKIRSQHREAAATIQLEEEAAGAQGPGWRARVVFRDPQLAVAPGQAAVFYRDDEVLGGGWIRQALHGQEVESG